MPGQSARPQSYPCSRRSPQLVCPGAGPTGLALRPASSIYGPWRQVFWGLCRLSVAVFSLFSSFLDCVSHGPLHNFLYLVPHPFVVQHFVSGLGDHFFYCSLHLRGDGTQFMNERVGNSFLLVLRESADSLNRRLIRCGGGGPVGFKRFGQTLNNLSFANNKAYLAASIEFHCAKTLAANESLLAIANHGTRVQPQAL